MGEDLRGLRRDMNRADQAIRQDVADLATALRAVNAKTQRVATTIVGPFGVGSLDVGFTWPTPWPDTAYGVWVSINSGTAALGLLSATVKAGSKTAQDCVITVANTGATAVGTFGIDVLGVRT